MTARTVTLEDEMRVGDEVVLRYRISHPVVIGNRYQLCLLRVNLFYRTRALQFLEYVKTELYDLAVKDYENSKQNGYPIHVYEAVEQFRLTYSRACMLSVVTDRYTYTGGAHGDTTRRSETWNLGGCGRMELDDFYEDGHRCQRFVLEEIRREIRRNPDVYFSDAIRLSEKNLREDQFFLTPRGIVVYYQVYDIAPHSSGIPEFLIPYGGCIRRPPSLCFRS